MRKTMKILIIVLIILVVLFFAFSLWMAGFVTHGSRQTLDEAFAWQSDHYDTSFYEPLEKTDYIVEGYEGYELHVQFLKNPVETDKYMILTHGYTDNRMGSLKYVKMYLDFGYNCIIYDIRGHGLNERTFTSYGILESQDLMCLIEDTRKRYTNIGILGLHGESLGSATTLTCLQYEPKVDFAVADCGFSDIENVLRNAYKSFHVPSGLFDIADFGCIVRYHYSLRDMRPIDALDENTIPVLFMHGAQDSLIVPKNSEDMAERTKGIKELYLIEGAGHAESIIVDPETYRAHVKGFLEHLGM